MIWDQAIKNWGQLAGYGAKRAWNTRTGRGAMIGAGLGAVSGAISDDTSVLGGAAMGAAGGAVGGRYLGAGARMAARGWAGKALGPSGGPVFGNEYFGAVGAIRGFGHGIFGQARRDFRGARLAANKAVNSFSALRGGKGTTFTGGTGI